LRSTSFMTVMHKSPARRCGARRLLGCPGRFGARLQGAAQLQGRKRHDAPTSQPGAPLASTLMASLCAGGGQTRCLRARAPVAETALAFITRAGFPALTSILLRTIINVGLSRNRCQQSCKRRHCRCSNQEVSHFYLPQVLCCACSRLFILSPGCMLLYCFTIKYDIQSLCLGNIKFTHINLYL
jgi:hypothetical protein